MSTPQGTLNVVISRGKAWISEPRLCWCNLEREVPDPNVNVFTDVFTGVFTDVFTDVFPDVVTAAFTGAFADVFTGIFADVFTGVFTDVFIVVFADVVPNPGRSLYEKCFKSCFDTGTGMQRKIGAEPHWNHGFTKQKQHFGGKTMNN